MAYKFDINNPHEYRKELQDAQRKLDALEKKFFSNWTYCCGCRDYVLVDSVIVGITDNNRPVQRCSKCGSIHRFLD